MNTTFIGFSLLLISDVAGQVVPQKDFLVPPIRPMNDDTLDTLNEDSSNGERPLAGLSEQSNANTKGQQDGTTVTDGAPTTAAAGANISTLFPTTTLAPNTAQAQAQGDDDFSGLSLDFLFELAADEGASFFLGFLESTLGKEAKRLLPKLKPLLPRLQKIAEDIVAGSTPDFTVLKELPAGLIRKLVPALTRGFKDSPLAQAIPEEVFDLLDHDSNLLPHILESVPEVAPLFFQFYQDSDLGALMDSLLELLQNPHFMREILANLLPQILHVTSLGDGVPPEVRELWPEFIHTLTEAIPMLQREVPQIQDGAKDGMRITEKLIKMVRPLYRRVVELMGLEDEQALVDTTELIHALAPIAKDLILAKSKQDLRTLVLRNMGRMIRIPTLFKRALSSITALSEDGFDADGDDDEEDEEEDYLKCATKCKEKVPKSAFDCEKSPMVVMRCLAVCEDNYITETYITELKLFEQYRYCDALSFMFFESASSGVCKPEIKSEHCKKYLSTMPDKYFALTTGQNFDDVLGDVNGALLADTKEGSNAGKTLTSSALMLPLFLF